jgi:hypothetical protein
MGWFENLKTRSKLLAGFGVMCALAGVYCQARREEG